MVKRFLIGMLAVSALAGSALAQEEIEYPAPTPSYAFHRSKLTRRLVAIPPYNHTFHVRIYTTPQHSPFYNVPPYAVVTPY